MRFDIKSVIGYDEHMGILIFIVIVMIFVVGMQLKVEQLQKSTKFFDEKSAAKFVQINAGVSFKEASTFLETEWEWQAKNAKQASKGLELVDRRNPQLLSYIQSKLHQHGFMTEMSTIELMVTQLEAYEDSLGKPKV